MSVLKRWNEENQVWEIIGMGTSQSAEEISGVTKITTKDPLYPDGKTGDVLLKAGDIEFDIAGNYDSSSIGYRLQQTISSTSPLIATEDTSYATINNALINGRVVYADVSNLRHYFMEQGTTSGISWIKFIANTGSNISVITYNSDGTHTSNTRNSSSVFWATYGTTTAQAILNANQAGQLCLVQYQSEIYTLSYYNTDSNVTVRFRNVRVGDNYTTIFSITCVNSSWTQTFKNIPHATTTTDLQTQITNVVNALYPVGSIYMSFEKVSPASFSIFSNTEWTRITGKFLLGATDSGSSGTGIMSTASVEVNGTGGSATHTLTSSQMPSHRHSIAYYASSGGTTGHALTRHGTDDPRNGNVNFSGFTGGTDAEFSQAGTTSAHNNMPPFIAVYMWKRIS